MVEEDLELERDVGEARIVYENPDGETVEQTVPNEQIAYFQDHWLFKTGEDEEGRDLVRRVPFERVYHVDRTVETFEEAVSSVRDQVESVADGVRSKLSDGGTER